VPISGITLKLGPVLGERNEVVIVKLGAPALVCGVLRQHGLAQGRADRSLLACVIAQLAPQNADRIAPLFARAVIPTLDR